MSRRVLVVVLLALAAVPIAAAHAVPGPCRVRDLDTDTTLVGTGANLQTAIDAAAPGATLEIRGRCVGTFEVPRRLTLVGRRTGTVRRPTLDGDGRGTVLTILGFVTVRNLRITGGDAGYGGGIYSTGRAVLTGHTVVRGNVARGGGGIFSEGALRLRERAVVLANRANLGGGIYLFAGGVRLSDHSAVRRNHATVGGGIYHEFDQLVLAGYSSVRANTARETGGGIRASGLMGDLVWLRGHARVVRNRAGDAGGGISVPAKGAVARCSPFARVSPNRPDDPPVLIACPD